jgi:hypothetical protein
MEPIEREMARFVAGRRNEEAIRLGKSHMKHGFAGDPLEIHIVGAIGEMAAAKAIGCYWGGDVNTWKKPDLPDHIQVRTRTKPHYQLLVRPDDKEAEIYVHVIAEMKGRFVPSVCDVRGWAFGSECKKAEHLRSWGGRPAAYFVPDDILHSIESLGQSRSLELVASSSQRLAPGPHAAE